MSAGAPGWNYGPRPDPAMVFDYFVRMNEHFINNPKEVEYRDLFWSQSENAAMGVLPNESIITGINPGADSWSYPVLDWRGQGAWTDGYGDNIPTVSRGAKKITMPIMLAAISSIVSTEEVRKVMMGWSLNLETDYERVKRMAMDRHIEGAFFFGDPDVGFLPFLDYPGVPIKTVATPWDSVPDVNQILADIADAMSQVWIGSGQKHYANTIMLPANKLARLAATARGAGTDTTVLNYLKQNNITSTLGMGELRIIAMPYLDKAGADGGERMIVASVSGDTLQMALPLPYTPLPPQYESLKIKTFAEYKFGPVHLPMPTTFLYVDGI
jgi:hypothetical protein